MKDGLRGPAAQCTVLYTVQWCMPYAGSIKAKQTLGSLFTFCCCAVHQSKEGQAAGMITDHVSLPLVF
jgi:hypothetical protein